MCDKGIGMYDEPQQRCDQCGKVMVGIKPIVKITGKNKKSKYFCKPKCMTDFENKK